MALSVSVVQRPLCTALLGTLPTGGRASPDAVVAIDASKQVVRVLDRPTTAPS